MIPLVGRQRGALRDAPRSRFGRAAGLGLWCLAAPVLALELGTRLLAVRFPSLATAPDTERRLWVYDRTKGWFHAPHATGLTHLGGPDEGRVRINSLGLRGGEVGRSRHAVPRVVVFGDSFVFGAGVDEEHTFVAQLQRTLAERTGRDHEVINAGVSGYSTDQEYLLFRELGALLEPDLVLLVTCDNDFDGNTEDFVYGRFYKPYFDLDDAGALELRNVPTPALGGWQRLRLWLGQHSNAWNLFRTRRSALPPVQRLLDALQVGVPHRSGGDPVAVTAALTVLFRDLADRLGSGFLTANTGHRGERTTLYHRLRPLLREAGVEFTGLEAAMAEARQGDPARAWEFPEDTHWNVAAHQMAAEVMWRHVGRLLEQRAGLGAVRWASARIAEEGGELLDSLEDAAEQVMPDGDLDAIPAAAVLAGSLALEATTGGDPQ